jgi:diguanylate cyclase (GGDEF)-like protein
VGAAERAGLYRPLAGDDARVAYWIRHVRIGVLLSEVSASAVVGYVLLTHSPGRNNPLILAMCGLVIVDSWATYDRQVLLIRTQETLASTDPLTGIPNRRAFLERVAQAVHAAAWGHLPVVCLVDLDGFKAVNDAGGHAAGDVMLKAVGSALGGAVGETDTVARLGGDEFAVLADTSVAFSGEMLADRLRGAVARIGHPAGITATVGVAEVQPGDDVEDLMHRADAAMYRSKKAGGNRVTVLDY